MADHPDDPSSSTRRALVASVAAIVAGALSQARAAGADAAGAAQEKDAPLLLDTLENLSSAPTGLKYRVQTPAKSSSAAVRIETSSAGLQVVAQEWAEAVGATITASGGLEAPAPGVLVVGQPAVVATSSNVADPDGFAGCVATAAAAQASGIMLNIGDVGVGLIGIQVPESNPALVSDALGATLTATTAGVFGVATTGVGIRGRALQPDGIGAVFEAPPGSGQVAAKVKGKLVVESGDATTPAATFAGDVDVNGTLRINGVPYVPLQPPIRGTGTIAARAESVDISHEDILPCSFVQVNLTERPRPKDLAVSHVVAFEGGFSVYLTGRTQAELGFSWIAFPC